MKAETHVEVYRAFAGELSARRLRWIPLWRAGVRVAARRRLALVVLYAPPVIATAIFGFVVYARFALQAGTTPEALGGGQRGAGAIAGALIGDLAANLIQVRQQIVIFHGAMSFFSASPWATSTVRFASLYSERTCAITDC